MKFTSARRRRRRWRTGGGSGSESRSSRGGSCGGGSGGCGGGSSHSIRNCPGLHGLVGTAMTTALGFFIRWHVEVKKIEEVK